MTNTKCWGCLGFIKKLSSFIFLKIKLESVKERPKEKKSERKRERERKKLVKPTLKLINVRLNWALIKDFVSNNSNYLFCSCGSFVLLFGVTVYLRK